MRGFFEIGIFHPKHETNMGTLWRSAYQLGSSGIFTIGRRYRVQASDTVKTYKQVPLRHYLTFADFFAALPFSTILVGIEMGGEPLSSFEHPQQAVYLLGAEDHGLPNEYMQRCHKIVSLESVRTQSYNVAVAGSLVMYHRLIQKNRDSPAQPTMLVDSSGRYEVKRD